MASSRHVATNENISTGGNNTRDYDLTNGELSNWEEATDIELVTALQSEVLECYDDAVSFDDYVDLEGATTSSSYFRIIRPASGEGHDGTPNNGVTFSTTNYYCLVIKEANSQIQDIIAKVNANWANPARVFWGLYGASIAFIGCIAVDSSNVGDGYIVGFQSYDGGTVYFVNCLVHNMTTPANGFRSQGVGCTAYVYNCTVDDCDYGLAQITVSTFIAKNCISSNNGNVDWYGTIAKTTCTAEGVTMTYANEAGDDFHTSDSDTVDQGTDLSADSNYAFDDDINDGVMGAGKAGETRSGTWDIGFDEHIALPSYIPRCYTLGENPKIELIH